MTMARYVLVAGRTTMRRLTTVVADLYPGGAVRQAYLVAPKWIVQLLAPILGINRDVVAAAWGPAPRFSSCKAEKDLGLVGWLPLEVSLYDMLEDLARKGLVRHPYASRQAARGRGWGSGWGEWWKRWWQLWG